MKIIKRLTLVLFCVFFSIAGCSQRVSSISHENEIKVFQYDMNIKFSDKKTTPLSKKDFKKFSSLDFFAIDSNYRIKATFIRTPDAIPFEMPTTTDRKSIEVKYGEARFNLDGKQLTLSIYQNAELIQKPQYKNYLFLPFIDKTNGNETYGGGRYLDLDIPSGDTIILDFNKAYNPYCAYNFKYSCPIPPLENHLKIAIKAGVKTFKSVEE